MTNQNNKNFNFIKVNNGIKFKVKVIPNASKCELVDIIDDIMKIKLNIPPIEGKANKQCVKFLSELFHVPKSLIEIVNGEKSRNKTILIKGDFEDLHYKLSSVFDKIN